MDRDHLKSLLEEVRAGGIEVEAAIERLRHMPFENLGFATLDHHRAIRTGLPEVIFGPGKTTEEVVAIASSTLPSEYLVFGCVAVSSMASLMAMPRLPAQCGSSATGRSTARAGWW